MDDVNYSPSFKLSLLTFLSIIFVVGFGLFYLHASLHILLLICLLIVSLSAWLISKNGFYPIKKAMNIGLSNSFPAIYIFILIGVLIAAFIQSGTVATFIYYGIKLISPAYFLPSGLILCSVMSLATGTSWGTVGTVGVVLLGIGGLMGIPLDLVAGMVISGACFGDKMSPVSDTTNLAAISAKVKLTDHIKSMSYSTAPTYFISLILFYFMGLPYAHNTLSTENLNALLIGIESLYHINIFILLPLVVMISLSIKGVDAVPTMFFSIVVAVLIAIFIQDKSVTVVLNALYFGQVSHSGISSLDKILGRGGMASMMWTLSLSLIALALGGVLSEFGFLRVLVFSIIKRVKRPTTLVATTIISCFIGNLTMSEAYMSIILGGHLFSGVYDKLKVNRLVLSRSLEDGGALTTALIPWTTAGAFFASSLGIDPLKYAPYAILNWLNPLISILFASLGVGFFKDRHQKHFT
ncbi:MAG: Na+/H+ antiporter NhaC [Psychromonas sp.]|nr:Na+/H+ antiporter NhaC [Psychromonas sp.]